MGEIIYLLRISLEIYNYDDYPNSDELYTKMKESGLEKLYTKKWFDKPGIS
jgi:hypothetical protein